VLRGGGDWLRTRPDGVSELDVRLTLRTDDGALIYVTYGGLSHRLPIRPVGEPPPDGRYIRTLPRFETTDARYAWLNRVLAVGVGRGTASGVAYSVFSIG